jgi:hypothetical protein
LIAHHKSVRQYLERHAEPESQTLPDGEWDQVVVIPAAGEGDPLHEAISSVAGPRVLVILVLNARADAPESWHRANDGIRGDVGGAGLHGLPSGQLFVIDRARDGAFLPPKEGVGLARKIGCDVALAIKARGQVASRFIHTTDADGVVPGDYFEQAAAHEGSGAAAVLHPFEHVPAADGGEPVLAILLYECWLRYHVLGLRAAGSPYGFHAIGSTLSIDALAYAQVRGFPRRMAGEDFYILSKLTKVGRVVSAEGEPIRLSGRVSDRVPFGTGRAMGELLAGPVSVAGYRLPDPEVYEALAAWIALLDAAAEDPSLGSRAAAEEWLAKRAAGLGKGAGPLLSVLESTGTLDLLAGLVEMPLDSSNRRRRLHTGFDGFRTLRLLHALRDAAHPPVPFVDAMQSARWRQHESRSQTERPGPAAVSELFTNRTGSGPSYAELELLETLRRELILEERLLPLRSLTGCD